MVARPFRDSFMMQSDDSREFAAQLKAVAARVEAGLAVLLADAPLTGEIARPARLMAAMRHGALDGGKRLRPFLLIQTAQALGGADLVGANLSGSLRAGLALELIHCYSLVHDDLPSMDNDDLRRGKPTVHKAYGEATAILAGDGLLTLAFEVLADGATHPDETVRAALVCQLARAAGLGGMVGGQMLDLAAEGRFADGGSVALDAPSIRQLQAMKTGALLHAAVMMGATHAGADAASCAALSLYAKAVGAAFQIADDILDVESSSEAMGKATAKDADAGKGTLVTLLGLGAAKAERDRLVKQAIAALAGFGSEADILRHAAHFVAQRQV
jgi:farnesyl diphosphate synthase